MTRVPRYRMIAVALLLLAGCETTGNIPVPPPKPPVPPALAEASPSNGVPPGTQSNRSHKTSMAKSGQKRGDGKNGETKDDGKEDKRNSPDQQPGRLIGLDEAAVQAQLGPPSAVEDHPPGKIWRFRNHACVLSLALYPEVETRAFRVLSYEVTSDDHTAGNKEQCDAKFSTSVATQ